MKTIKNAVLTSLLALGAAAPAFAQESKKESEFQLLLGGALELGGDNIATVYFTNGEDQKVNAGQGGSIAVGGQLKLANAPRFLLRTTVGFKYLTTQADNVHIRLTRIPFITTANWMVAPKLRIGAGLSAHTGIRFKTGGIGDDMKFKGAVGPILEIAYSGIGLSYTAMKYTDTEKNTYSANAIGITISGVVRPKKK
ncbi:hypothetical protein SAMN05444008_10788 [Cnuella takakiae]|uniref:Outer membrane protein beta-barrel domain-containing protein n=1 Tax=Cnuella takakiae TaxID=1302690 RepID=A0A1M5B0M2_9BACT|nr:hypothetical protein [Cnuella takakiae]OLY93294.1 hypothetical protein BUE76_16420 [Cnuella takakiae]SHF36064.1 hypothetical protein SAMN05444008_10788 [Cnuella takakiae]